MTQIICLANSWKLGDRCIAGIDPATGKWIRPVSNLPDGRVPKGVRLIEGKEPALLDILEIPLANTGPDFGFECENRSILPGAWRRVSRASLTDIARNYNHERYICHNSLKYVTVPYLQSLPFDQRLTLQLVHVVEILVRLTGQRAEGGNKWEGSFVRENGRRLNARITDPMFVG